jgi:uncharacterized membrane protein YdcZ (DUF606 family)
MRQAMSATSIDRHSKTGSARSVASFLVGWACLVALTLLTAGPSIAGRLVRAASREFSAVPVAG